MPANRLVVGLAAIGMVALAWAVVRTPSARIVYNASASMPTGWYLISPAESIVPADTVLVQIPEAAAKLAAARHYLPANVPLIKRVFATSPSRVCIRARQVIVDGRVVARWQPHDLAGRPLPRWNGCRALSEDELWLLSPDHPDSFDSRYFGPLRRDAVLGIAHPVRLDKG
jgi:conjugative transfer signal peptidase TraF